MRDNSGAITLSYQESLKNTVIITSASGRSGTTALTHVCSALGVNMLGKNTSNFEDARIRELIKNRKFEVINNEYIEKYKNQLWGFKIPDCLYYIHKRTYKFQNPAILFITRDTTATVVRQFLTDYNINKNFKNSKMLDNGDINADNFNNKTDFFQQLLHTSKKNFNAIERLCLMSQEVPIQLISYEILMEKPELVIKQIANFLHIPYTAEACKEIIRQDPRYFINDKDKK